MRQHAGRITGFHAEWLRLMSVAAVLMFMLGIAALLTGQPYAVWHPLVLLGALNGLLFSVLYPVVRNHYDQRDLMKIDAEDKRAG